MTGSGGRWRGSAPPSHAAVDDAEAVIVPPRFGRNAPERSRRAGWREWLPHSEPLLSAWSRPYLDAASGTRRTRAGQEENSMVLRFAAIHSRPPVRRFALAPVRRFGALFAAGGLALALASCGESGKPASKSETPAATNASAGGKGAEIAGLLQPGPLGDRVIGKPDAPVTIVEYASLTCSHCANFHQVTYPALKEKYIDTGKVRLIFREFPLDPLSTAASMIARCAPEPRYFPLVSVLFQQQRGWAGSDKPLEELLTIARQAGFTQETFDACLKNQSIYDGLNDVKKRGAEVFGVNSTPTFFVNGQVRRGDATLEELEKLIEPLLK
jgi:protein-disulfide isomerase